MNWRCRLGLHKWKYCGDVYFDQHKSMGFGHINKRSCERCDKIEMGNYTVVGPFKINQSSTQKVINSE